MHTFDASPLLFRLATEALRTQLTHSFDPKFAVSVSRVDPLPHQVEAVYKHILPPTRSLVGQWATSARKARWTTAAKSRMRWNASASGPSRKCMTAFLVSRTSFIALQKVARS